MAYSPARFALQRNRGSSQAQQRAHHQRSWHVHIRQNPLADLRIYIVKMNLAFCKEWIAHLVAERRGDCEYI